MERGQLNEYIYTCILDLNESAYIVQASEDTTLQRRQTRHGKLHVYRLTSGQSLTTETILDMPGILDIKWSPSATPEGSIAALVNSVGQLRLYTLAGSDDGAPDKRVNMSEVTTFDLGDDCLGLSLDWSNRVNNG